MGIARWLIVLASTAIALHAIAADKRWTKLRGNALTQAFTNQDFGDGVHFAYQFMAGGELRGMNMGKPAQGHWRIKASELCWRWAKTTEECYEVRRQGQYVHLFVDNQEVLAGKLSSLLQD